MQENRTRTNRAALAARRALGLARPHGSFAQSASLPFKNLTLGFTALAIFRCRLKLRLLISISATLARNGHVPP